MGEPSDGPDGIGGARRSVPIDPLNPLQYERKGKRFKIFEAVTINTGSTDKRAHILDISSTGGRFHCDESLQRGQQITISLGSRALNGIVAWAREQRFGVRFTTPIEQSEIMELLPAKAPTGIAQ